MLGVTEFTSILLFNNTQKWTDLVNICAARVWLLAAVDGRVPGSATYSTERH
jgi:hypothetical protein